MTNILDDRQNGRAADRMGPRPEISVTVLADLGLSDERICRYFGVHRDRVAEIRQLRCQTGQNEPLSSPE